MTDEEKTTEDTEEKTKDAVDDAVSRIYGSVGKRSVTVRRTQIGDVLEDKGEEDLIKITPFITSAAEVTVSAGVTKNMGNFVTRKTFSLYPSSKALPIIFSLAPR